MVAFGSASLFPVSVFGYFRFVLFVVCVCDCPVSISARRLGCGKGVGGATGTIW